MTMMRSMVWMGVMVALAGCQQESPQRTATERGPEAGPQPTGQVTPAPSGRQEVAILAGGCFWGMEEILRGVPGVLDTDVGYAGGTTPSPSYAQVKTGTSGHAESVRIVFDPAQLSYETLLRDWFFRMHDPTTKNRQGNDVGTQYRSAIFATSEAQANTAREVIGALDEDGTWGDPIVTEVVRSTGFTDAESYHQDYLQKHPTGYTCHYLRE